MINEFETSLFFATTVSALSLAAVVSVQSFSADQAVQQAVAMPTIQMEQVEIVGQRVAPVAARMAPEQVALVR